MHVFHSKSLPISYNSIYAGTPFESQSQQLGDNEQRRNRDRNRYAQIPDKKKQEILRKRHEAYQEKNIKKDPVSDQKKKEKKCIRERAKYQKMQPGQKKARFEQVAANRALRRDTLSKDSIAMVNPAYEATEKSTKVNSCAIKKTQRKHEKPAEKHQLLAQNKSLTTTPFKTISAPPEKDSLMRTEVTNHVEPVHQEVTNHAEPVHQEVMKEGNTQLQT